MLYLYKLTTGRSRDIFHVVDESPDAAKRRLESYLSARGYGIFAADCLVTEIAIVAREDNMNSSGKVESVYGCLLLPRYGK